jgi:glucosamine 6-phosphate synthetase-like amidotransferase/phosphosugar isomerase protein
MGCIESNVQEDERYAIEIFQSLARIGRMDNAPNQKYLFARIIAHEAPADSLSKLTLPAIPSTVMPLAYAVPVQLIAYHTAFVMGKDVDQPRSVASRSPWNDRR